MKNKDFKWIKSMSILELYVNFECESSFLSMREEREERKDHSNFKNLQLHCYSVISMWRCKFREATE